MKRFLLLIVLCLIGGGLKTGLGGEASAADRPNFLVLITDDQRYDALGVVQKELGDRGRFPWFETPHMDRLAAEGVRFRNAFVVNSLCAPSRAVMLTGRYNHFNGVASNFRPFPVENVTYATILQRAGYVTGYFGKWHMDSQQERPGFDFFASFVGQGRYFDCPLLVQGTETATTGWVDDVTTEYVVRFIREHSRHDRPWLAVLGFKAPHGPFTPPERAKERFSGCLAKRTPNFDVRPPYLGPMQNSTKQSSDQATPAEVPVNLDYFRCISAVDDCVGRLLEELDECGVADNTIVIFQSDNGYYLGEHGLGDKRSAYEESLRIPLLARYPRGIPKGLVRDEMVLNLDLAPTILDFAGVPIPPEMQGQSWRPLAEGKQIPWRKAWLYEYFAEKQRNSRVPDIVAVRTESAKLITYPGHEDWTELFDLKSDPYETKNLYHEPSAANLRAELEAELKRLQQELGYRVPEYVDRPDWWGGTPPDPNAPPEICLDYRFDEYSSGGKIQDQSPRGNHAVNHGTIVTSLPGHGAVCVFDGNSYIEVPKSASLNPAGMSWTVEVTFHAEKPDGVLVARGGQSHGYALWLRQGHPVWTVVINNKAFSVETDESVEGWQTVTGVITPQHAAELYIGGKLAGRRLLPDFILTDPNDSMQIGADTGSPIVPSTTPKFQGEMKRVAIWRGARRPAP
ncbi:sulfatase-like hydrolase/transferase [Thermogutta sp.]|uniref:sulfatase-like hydrolase/transferase n=1 Tax=Thermogutta sp. TaxID=1962930 RepID=UPI0032209850